MHKFKTDEEFWEAADYYHDLRVDKQLEELAAKEKLGSSIVVLDQNVSELESLLTEYRDLKVEMAYYLEVLRTLEKRIKAHVKETGETAEIDGARVIVRPSKPRERWDPQGLTAYAITNPDILQYKTMTTYSPAVIIQVD